MIKQALRSLLATLLLVGLVVVAIAVLRPTADNRNIGSATPPPNFTAPAKPDLPTTTATVNPECGTAVVSYDAAEPTIANRAEGAAAVVIATVEAVDIARWNTESGAAPIFDDSPPDSAYIYRPTTLSVGTVARGNTLTESPTVRLLGGTVGCYSFDFEDAPELKIGRQYAFFLGPALDINEDPQAQIFSINEAWEIEDGFVSTPLEGQVPLATFAADVAQAPTGPFGE